MPTIIRKSSPFSLRFLLVLLLPLVTVSLSACHSYHVEATVVNQTGETIERLEIQYPSASFGADHLAPEQTLHYRLQLLGQGNIKVHYFTGLGHQVETVIDGPELHELQEGSLQIILHPGGKADFLTQFKP